MLNKKYLLCFVIFLVSCCFFGCYNYTDKMISNITKTNRIYKVGDIVNSDTKSFVTLKEMISDLKSVSIIYIGEKHENFNHHKKKLEIIDSLKKHDPNLQIGMEMFDYTYEDVLSSWTQGYMSKSEFLKASHWYANWRFAFELYEEILNYAKNNNLKIKGINIPFHIPAKISTGGIDSLLNIDKQHLPRKIDLTNNQHRLYMKDIYQQHQFIYHMGRNDFELFYEAQCVWEDFMAQKIVENFDKNLSVILVGNGHIINKLGIPNRAYNISYLSFKTVYLANVDENIEYSFADYIIFTDNKKYNIKK